MNDHYRTHQLAAVDLDQADPAQREVLETARQQVGFIPNMYANMVNVPAVLSTYLQGYAAFRKTSGLTPAEQEVVFLAISRQNDCHYCTAAHSMIADKLSKVPTAVLAAIRADRPLPDAKLAALYEFSQELVRTGGRPSNAGAARLFAAGYDEKTILNIILAAAVKTLSNYSNHLFGTAVDDAFADYRVG